MAFHYQLRLLACLLSVSSFTLATGFCQYSPQSRPADDQAPTGKWIQLFNGKDLQGWTPKIRYHQLGDNYGNTFRVEDGLMKVRYDADKYPNYGERFGHVFYKQPYTHYPIDFRKVELMILEDSP